MVIWVLPKSPSEDPTFIGCAFVAFMLLSLFRQLLTGFEDLTRVVNVADTIRAIGEISGGHGQIDFQGYLNRPSTGGGVWFIDSTVKKAGLLSGFKAPVEENDFQSCLNAYFGAEVSQIRDAVDSRWQSVLQDVLSFLYISPKAALRLKGLAPYVQNKCYESMSTILTQLKREIDNLYAAIDIPLSPYD